MSGPILHLGATVTCSHGGQALPTTPSPRVLVSGQPVVTQTSPWTVAGCGFTPPALFLDQLRGGALTIANDHGRAADRPTVRSVIRRCACFWRVVSPSGAPAHVWSPRHHLDGAPAVLQSSTSVCVPTGTPLIPVQAQTRVIGI